jgi:hypothetical protein
MSNALEAIAPKILARGMMHFRQKAIMPRLINSDFSAEAAQKGDTIDIPVANTIAVEDVTPSHTPPAFPDQTSSTISVKLDHWKRAAFYLTDKELTQIDADNSYVPLHMREAVSALAGAINVSVLNLYKKSEHMIGSPSGTLFSQNTDDQDKTFYGVKPIIEARKILNKNGAPKEGRYGVLSLENEAQMLALPQFGDANRAGDTNVTIHGDVGQRYGINWYSSDDVIAQSRLKDILDINSTIAKGSQSFTLGGVDHDLNPHDVIASSGEITGVIASTNARNSSNRSQQVTTQVPIRFDLKRSSGTFIVDDLYNNLVFHSDAFVLAMRPLTSSAAYNGLGNRIMSVTDPETGLSMRLEISRQYKQTVWEFDVLWGVEMVRPKWVIRLAG